MDYKAQLEKLERDINAKKLQKARLEERKRNLELQVEELQIKLAKLVPAGCDLTTWLAKEEQAITEGIAQCEQILQSK